MYSVFLERVTFRLLDRLKTQFFLLLLAVKRFDPGVFLQSDKFDAVRRNPYSSITVTGAII